ncbi:MAG: hypothetical protein ACRDRP_13660 [Pseudonocardiaceae bacterium]
MSSKRCTLCPAKGSTPPGVAARPERMTSSGGASRDHSQPSGRPSTATAHSAPSAGPRTARTG